jgi:hypothetical protein
MKVTVIRESAQETTFAVDVEEGASATHHEVTATTGDLTRLARRGETPAQLIERCFAFLLAREPKESILRRFDVSVISRYFPEFERTIRQAPDR